VNDAEKFAPALAAALREAITRNPGLFPEHWKRYDDLLAEYTTAAGK